MKTINKIIRACVFPAAALMTLWAGGLLNAPAALAQQVQLPGSAIPQFVDALPGLHTIIAGPGQITLEMTEFKSNVMPSSFVPAAGEYTGTWVWGYLQDTQEVVAGTSYIGPVIVAARYAPTEINFVNNLGTAGASNVLAWATSTDKTLHWADPLGDDCMSAVLPGQPPAGGCELNYDGPVPAVPHLHGGEVPPVIDGSPNSWFTSDGAYKGNAYYTKAGAAPNAAIYRYPNWQEAGPLWFHDHALGITRLNVYAGLAGGYVLTDPGNPPPANLQGPAEIVPLVIQDRSFDVDGQLFFPNTGINPEHPFWIPEFEGDTIVVNGKVWPYLSVEPKRYRFLIINGSNARAYEMFLVDQDTGTEGPPIWQIGTDGGYLDFPVKIDPADLNLSKLAMQPGERAEIIVDFAGFDGQTLILRNTARHPYPKGAPVNGMTTGRIMQIRVNQPLPDDWEGDASYDPSTGATLRPSNHIVRLVDPAAGTLAEDVTADETRQLTLNEVMGAGGPLEVLVNNTKWNGRQAGGGTRDDFTAVTIGGLTEYYSELPNEGDTEVWEIVNLTADAHPIHLHLVQFQLVNRQNYNFNRYNKDYNAAFPSGDFEPGYGPPLDYNTGNPRALGGNPDITPYLQGPVMPPRPNEAGWKDTVQMFPGQVTRIAVRWAPTDKPVGGPGLNYPFDPRALGFGYVWHCHIIDHEDNEMMRPDRVTPLEGAVRSLVLGFDY